MADATDNIAKALGYKEEGNTHFKAGEYKKAMVAYHNIFMYVHGFSEKRDAGSSSAGLMPGSTTQAVGHSPDRNVWYAISRHRLAPFRSYLSIDKNGTPWRGWCAASRVKRSRFGVGCGKIVTDNISKRQRGLS